MYMLPLVYSPKWWWSWSDNVPLVFLPQSCYHFHFKWEQSYSWCPLTKDAFYSMLWQFSTEEWRMQLKTAGASDSKLLWLMRTVVRYMTDLPSQSGLYICQINKGVSVFAAHLCVWVKNSLKMALTCVPSTIPLTNTRVWRKVSLSWLT